MGVLIMKEFVAPLLLLGFLVAYLLLLRASGSQLRVFAFWLSMGFLSALVLWILFYRASTENLLRKNGARITGRAQIGDDRRSARTNDG